MSNIGISEYTTLQSFDMELFVNLPVPSSFLFVVISLVSVLVYRTVQAKKRRPRQAGPVLKFWNGIFVFTRKNAMRIIFFHIVAMVAGLVVKKGLSIEALDRICSILIPVVSYFLCCYWIMKGNFTYPLREATSRNVIIRYSQNFINFSIETPVFLLSVLTLGFLFLTDTGFAILFFFFLLSKFILTSFHRPPFTRPGSALAKLTQPAAYIIFGFVFLAVFFIAIGYKKSFFYILEYKLWFIGIIVVLAMIVLGIGRWKGYIRKIGLAVCVLALAALVVPPTKSLITDFIDYKTRLVKYRTSMLTEPIEDLLFHNKYNSDKERKIIETAQGQWFINNYLNTDKDDNRKIRLRQHFNTGVDYVTQTRDVILPRYVIAEFGRPVMVMLLVLAALPLALFFLGYRIIGEKRQFNTGSVMAAMALILFFTLALFVWLTSTNRFVFFGQDFPFLSLTSRVSTLLPVVLFTCLLFQKPLIRKPAAEELHFNTIRWSVFTVLLALVILVSGQSNIMAKKNFEINFDGLRARVDNINEVYARVQSGRGAAVRFSEKDFRQNSDAFFDAVRGSLDRLYSDKEFSEIIDSATLYEKSLLEELQRRPRLGFLAGSPIHLKYDTGEKIFKLLFNEYFHRELPAYDVREVWQGDITENIYNEDDINRLPVLHKISPISEVIVVPPAFLEPGQKPLGLLSVQGRSSKQDLCYIFNKKTKTMREYERKEPVAPVDEDHIVFLVNDRKNTFNSWVLRNTGNQYFAYNFLINGHQKHIYPMGEKLYWARHWTSASKAYFEKQQELESNTSISLDFDLNYKVNNLLQRNLKSKKAQLPEMTFSVMGADGDGRIRLLADYAAQREIIDPNDERRINKKQAEQYFNVDSKAERLQWSNLNLLRMELGPGSSLKPIVSAAVTSQLNAEWDQLKYIAGPLGVTSKGKPAITHYAGLDLREKSWPVESSNSETGFVQYISSSNNLYHSLIMFLGAYEKEDFRRDSGYTLRNVLRRNMTSKNIPAYPVMTLGADGAWYFQGVAGWPKTTQNPASGEPITWFGNKSSLLAVGLNQNFDLNIEPSDRYGQVNRKTSFSTILPETLTGSRTWATPESSHFFQGQRTATDTIDNFGKGLRFPALGGHPWAITPLHMIEMYGKMVSENPLYRISIDQPLKERGEWNKDERYTASDSYESFLVDNIFGGMKAAVISGTGERLTHGVQHYRGYYLYTKTGTIGSMNNDNSKRLALIITKEPISTGNLATNRFYVLYFTIGNAYDTDDSDKFWHWDYYRQTLDHVISSKSFSSYMNANGTEKVK